MFRQLQRRWQPRSLQQRFQRHCQELFPFHHHLTDAELAYLRRCCFGEDDDESVTARPWRGVFGHRVYEDRVDSSALAPRLTMPAEEAWEAALATMPPLRKTYVLATTHEIDACGCSWRFDGLGWHITRGDVRVHWYVPSAAKLAHTPWGELWEQLSQELSLRPEAMISLLMREHRIVGHAVIGYPQRNTIAEGVSSPDPASQPSVPLALSVTSHRDQPAPKIQQVRAYAGASSHLPRRLNHLGRHLLKRYERWGEWPEAFAFHSSHDCVIYTS